MNQYKDLFENIYKPEDIKIDEKMSEYIYFKVGGNADVLLMPNNIKQVEESLKICKENNIPYYIMGNGSNILVKDNGIRGVVINLCKLNEIQVKDDEITAACGALLIDVSKAASKHKLTGFEFACGIPGSVGGAVYMNAGAYDGEVSFVIDHAQVLNEKNELITLNKEELDLGYRHSIVMEKGFVVISATFKLKHGESEKIDHRVKELTTRREERQPLEYPSAGSTFKRPEGHFAGKLIQDAGLKGYTVGGACVSEKHAGFVINKNHGTAQDVLDVIHHVQDEVKKQFGVELHPEVRIWGE